MRIAFILGAAALALGACKPAVAAPPAPVAPLATPAPANPVLGGVDLSQDLRLIGSEPFWQVHVSKAELKLESAEMAQPLTFPNLGPTMTPGQAVWESSQGMVNITLTLTAAKCSDGMSEREYPLTAQVEADGETYKGCAVLENDLGPRDDEPTNQ